ncbi:MAG: hypothetical protein KAS32_27200 [Candidatus Peribacteraceae bacterium]|nr:hypothetical protein [Candidatus Peribacteraceae bacterium]
MMEYNVPMNGADIARELGISRQAVSCRVRGSMKKMYRFVLDEKIADTPFQAIIALMGILGVTNSDVGDVQQFLKMFDKDIIADVTKEALSTYNIQN